MIRITCGSCHKPILVDETRLPMREVSFPCPACRASVTVDRRTFQAETPAERSAPAAPPPLSQPLKPPSLAAPAPSSPSMLTPPGPDASDSELPFEDDLSPKALIVGVDAPLAREAAQSLGLQAIHIPGVEASRDYFLREHPPIVFLCPAQLTRPPLEEMQALTGVNPADRRRSFFILLADGLRTFDGNAAFFYNVNLIVANKDVGSIPQIYREAEAHHRRLYHSFWAAQKEVSG